MPRSKNEEDWRASPPPTGTYEATKLSTAVTEILNEARTILPGVQALVGFQFIAVFNQSFWDRFNETERALHVGAILLSVLAMILLITPPVFHRERESGYDSAGLVKLASRLLTAATYPLIASMAIDLYLIGRLVGGSIGTGLLTAMLVIGPAVVMWHVMPRSGPLREWLRR